MSKSGKQDIKKEKSLDQKEVTPDFENTGNYLRTLRLGKGLSTKDVTEATRISETNIKAIEDQDYSSLPADTFTRGLLNIYATFLGVDAEAVIEKFLEERSRSSSTRKRTKPKKTSKILAPKRLAEPTHVSSMTMAAILLVVIIVSFAGYCVYTSWNPFSSFMKEKDDIQSVMKNVFPQEKEQTGILQNESVKDIIAPEKDTSPASEPESTVNKDEHGAAPAEPPTSDAEAMNADPEEKAPVIEDNTVKAPVEKPAPNEKELSEPFKEVSPENNEKTLDQEKNYTASIRFLKDTSVDFTIDVYQTGTKEFKTGDIHTWQAKSSLFLIFSQPNSAEIIINDSAIDFPALQDGNYTLHIPLDLKENQSDE